MISKQSILQNLSDLNTEEIVSKDLRDAIERVTDDVKELLEVLMILLLVIQHKEKQLSKPTKVKLSY